MYEEKEKKRPNVIFLLSDQQRYDTVSCYGEALGAGFKLTPNLDRLAAEGTRFTNAYTCQPVCGPARACIQTGLYPDAIGCHVNDRMLPQGTKTIANYFREAGYETAYVGKWHLASQYSFGDDPQKIDYKTKSIPQLYRGGYQDFWIAADVLEFTSHGYGGYMYDGNGKKREFSGYRADATTDFVLEYLQRPKEKPFFLFVSYIEPHYQNDHMHHEGPLGSKEKYGRFAVPGDLEGTEGDWREEMPDYLGCCHSLDENVGRLVDYLKKSGLYENTVIFYTSDHGSHFRTRNSEYKRSCHDASIHIPLLAKGGCFDGGHTIDELVSLVDFAPTILQAAGIEARDMKGRPIQELMRPGAAPIQKEIFIQISESCVGRALRTKEFTYAVQAGEGFDLSLPAANAYRETYLYDMRKDPYQKENLVSQHGYAAVRKELRERLLRKIEEEEGRTAVIMEG